MGGMSATSFTPQDYIDRASIYCRNIPNGSARRLVLASSVCAERNERILQQCPKDRRGSGLKVEHERIYGDFPDPRFRSTKGLVSGFVLVLLCHKIAQA